MSRIKANRGYLAYSQDDYKRLSMKIMTDIFRPSKNNKITIFLCGADIRQKDKLRYKIAELINIASKLAWTKYELLYPEDIFDELLYGSSSVNLLTLENLLADSVDVILLIPESPGSFAELGAFANNVLLRKKIICLVDNQYQKAMSFINKGPIKLIKSEQADAVIFLDPFEIARSSDKIFRNLRRIKKENVSVGSRLNLLEIADFLLPSIFLMQPVAPKMLINLVSNAMENEEAAESATRIALSILFKKKFITRTTFNFIKLTKLGLNEFNKSIIQSPRTKLTDKIRELDNIRLEILNLNNRNKKLKV